MTALIVVLCFALPLIFCAANSPKWLRYWSIRARARADMIEASEREYKAAIVRYRAEFTEEQI